MKILERIIKKKQYYVICSKCKKEIVGNAESQVIYNFKKHKKYKCKE
jgi:hypothetical protein